MYADMYRRLGARQRRARGQAFAYLADASKSRCNRLDPDCTELLLEAACKETQAELSLDELTQAGLIEYRMQENQYAHQALHTHDEDHYRIPIPSFADHTIKKHPDKGGRRATILQEQLSQMRTIPTWTWREEDEIEPFLEPLANRLAPHVAGIIPKLLPAIPGDQPTES